MKKLMVFCVILLIPNLAEAQGVVWHIGDRWLDNHYSRQNPEIERETVNKMKIDNYDYRIRTKWAIKDEARKRRLELQKYNHWLEKKKRKLDLWEEKARVEQREKELIEKGIYPAKPKVAQVIVFRGMKYDNLNQLTQSFEWQIEIAIRRLQREADNNDNKQKHQWAWDFERKRREYSPSVNFFSALRHDERQRVGRIMRGY